jgi:nucleoside-diphosphate-sugar epimerase
VKVLVTGGAGYLGSVLVPKLMARGHQVRVVDVGYFGLDHLRRLQPTVEVVREDLRAVLTDTPLLDQLLSGTDALIHLAAISNDPSAELNPELTEVVNVSVTEQLALAARDRGIKFLFSSSCSVYGEADGLADERHGVAPLTTYAVSKIRAEEILDALTTPDWRPVVLRNGTLFGFSPRMRFDLVVNIFSLYSTLYNQVKVFGEGQQWRPFLHVGDCARAFVHFMELAGSEHQCFNIAHENLRVVDIVDVFRDINAHLDVVNVPAANDDKRDYRVSTARMTAAGFQPRITIGIGAEEMIEAILTGRIPDPESIYYRNSKWLKELTGIEQTKHREIADLIEAFARTRVTGR